MSACRCGKHRKRDVAPNSPISESSATGDQKLVHGVRPRAYEVDKLLFLISRRLSHVNTRYTERTPPRAPPALRSKPIKLQWCTRDGTSLYKSGTVVFHFPLKYPRGSTPIFRELFASPAFCRLPGVLGRASSRRRDGARFGTITGIVLRGHSFCFTTSSMACTASAAVIATAAAAAPTKIAKVLPVR